MGIFSCNNRSLFANGFGYNISLKINDDLILKAIKNGLIKRCPCEKLIFHSRSGSQYFSKSVIKIFGKNGIISSMSNKGNCLDNAVVESFFAILKKENAFLLKYKNYVEANWVITDYIEMFYNSKRQHSFLDYNSPLDFENKNEYN